MTKHLVLGGGGFIGSHLCKRLHDQGDDVTAVDVEFPEYRYDQWKGVTTLNVDLLGYAATGQLFWHQAKPRWDVVWQLAADMGGVEYFHSDRDWAAAVANQQINANVMAAIGHRWTGGAHTGNDNRPRVVFTSTACALATEKQKHVYREYFTPHTEEWLNLEDPSFIGFTDRWELTERDIEWGTPDQLYGQEKRNSALLWANAPLDSRVAFLHTVYGPYQEHSGIRMKFPSAVAMKARKARETGTIELLGRGSQVRSYLYIDDAVDRLLALGASEVDPGFVNIGGVKPYTVDEVARIAAVAAGAYDHREDPTEDQLPELVHIPGPEGVEARCADMSRFNEAFPQFLPETGKQGEVVSLEDGMQRFIDWLDAQ